MGLLSPRMRRGLHVLEYRTTGGLIGGMRSGDGYDIPILLLTTTGRKTGKTHTVPLGYLEDGSNYLIVGSYGGAVRDPAWILNLDNNPAATIQVKRRRIPVLAERPSPDERTRLWTKLVESNPVFGVYQGRTSREIPLIVLRPQG